MGERLAVAETRYRDPRPEEIYEDEGPWMKMLPPERQAYWRQVTDDSYPPVPRYANAMGIEADVRTYQVGWFVRCVGMNREALSKEAVRLIKDAHETGSWQDKLDQLIFLRGQMQYHEGGR